MAATLASMLQQAGHKTGLYTSPHLCSFRERIRINGEPISETDLLAAATPLLPHIEQSEASFFEATTVIAFHALAKAGVDVGVIEVGLGGRLDATNVITPELCVITNIAFDHAEYLGNTIESIAQEKAGIIKPNVPVITAEADPKVLEIFAEKADAAGTTMVRAPRHQVMEVSRRGVRVRIPTEHWGELEVAAPLIGRHQAQNVALAVGAADLLAARFRLDQQAVRSGVAGVRWPGRFQIERRGERLWVFDVAHNEAGVRALVSTFQLLGFPRPVALLVGILGDKDWAGMLPQLFGLADHIVLSVPPTAPPNRAWNPEQVLAQVPHPAAEVVADFGAALARVQELAGAEGTILVTGSFHTVGDALGILGWCETDLDI